jgi:hypothetical protein
MAAGALRNLDAFREGFRGYRANRFIVFGSFPGSISSPNSDTFELYVKAAQIPGAAVGYVPMTYRGRNIKFPAERSFMDWGMQVYASNSKANDLRNKFIQWISLINNPDHTIMNWTLTSPEPWIVSFNDMKDNSTQSSDRFKDSVEMWNCFPIEVSPIEMNNDVTDSFAEFTLTMAYDYSVNRSI